MVFAIEEAAVGEPTVQTFRSIHEVLMRRAPNAPVAGVVRREQNWIGGNDYNPCGAAFVPPPPEFVEPLLEDLAAACADDMLPPLLQAAIVHAQFETIHPFLDGNGRTGRALIHVVLRRRGLAPRFVPPISVVFARKKDAYIRGLTAFREDDLGAWIESFATAALRSAALARAYLTGVRAMQDRWRERLAAGPNPRADAAAWAIVDVLPAHPVVSVPVAVVATGRTRPAATNGIDHLVEVGILVPTGPSQRNRTFEAPELVDLIAGLEAGETPG